MYEHVVVNGRPFGQKPKRSAEITPGYRLLVLNLQVETRQVVKNRNFRRNVQNCIDALGISAVINVAKRNLMVDPIHRLPTGFR